MKIQDWMSRSPITCSPEDSLQHAAGLLWSHDLGCLPVVGADQKVLGMLTDRDLCMAAFTRGSGLAGHSVASAMARQVFTLSATDSVKKAHALLRQHQLRRAPVLDKQGRLVGMLTLGDLALGGARLGRATRRKSAGELAETFAAIVAPRAPLKVAKAAKPAAEATLKPAASSVKKPARTPKPARAKRARGTRSLTRSR